MCCIFILSSLSGRETATRAATAATVRTAQGSRLRPQTSTLGSAATQLLGILPCGPGRRDFLPAAPAITHSAGSNLGPPTLDFYTFRTFAIFTPFALFAVFQFFALVALFVIVALVARFAFFAVVTPFTLVALVTLSTLFAFFALWLTFCIFCTYYKFRTFSTRRTFRKTLFALVALFAPFALFTPFTLFALSAELQAFRDANKQAQIVREYSCTTATSLSATVARRTWSTNRWASEFLGSCSHPVKL